MCVYKDKDKAKYINIVTQFNHSIRMTSKEVIAVNVQKYTTRKNLFDIVLMTSSQVLIATALLPKRMESTKVGSIKSRTPLTREISTHNDVGICHRGEESTTYWAIKFGQNYSMFVT